MQWITAIITFITTLWDRFRTRAYFVTTFTVVGNRHFYDTVLVYVHGRLSISDIMAIQERGKKVAEEKAGCRNFHSASDVTILMIQEVSMKEKKANYKEIG